MNIYRLVIATCLIQIAALSPTHAAPGQKGPAYYTDVHGAAAMVQAMHAVAQFDDSYLPYRDGAMSWMLNQTRQFQDKGRTWLQNPSAVKGFPNYHTTITVVGNYNAQTALEIYEETQNPQLLTAVKEHINWLSNSALKKNTESGTVNFWKSKHSLDTPQVARNGQPLASGFSWGFGNILDTLSLYHEVTGDTNVLQLMENGSRYAYLSSIKSYGDTTEANRRARRGEAAIDFADQQKDEERVHWNRLDGSTAMGFCRGISGNLFGLLKTQRILPGAALADGRTIEDLINSGLRYLMDTAMTDNQTITWDNMNGRPGERSLAIGRGIGGIGRTLWRGYEMNHAIGNKAMAERCRAMAEMTVQAILKEIEARHPNEPLTEWTAIDAPKDRSGRLVETIGWCSGISGCYQWLYEYADAIRDKNPNRATRCEEATRTLALRIINTAYEVDGTYAWKNHNPKFGAEKVVNMAIDHGQTGVVVSLAEMGWRLKDKRIMDAARKAADFVVMNSVEDKDGRKMLFLAPIANNVPRVKLKID